MRKIFFLNQIGSRFSFLRVPGVLAVSALAFCLAGCSGVQRPVAKVAGIAVTDRSSQGERVEFTLELHNPNKTPLPIHETRYTVMLGERGSAQAQSFRFISKAKATMPAKGTQTLTLSAAFKNGQTPADRQVSVRGEVVYVPPGEMRDILTQSYIPLPSVGFAAKSTLPGRGDKSFAK